MMMTLLCRLIYFSLFIGLSSHAVHSLPKNCYKSGAENCIVDSQNNYFFIDAKNIEISLGKNTQIVINNQNQLTLIKGTLFVQKNESAPLSVATSEVSFELQNLGGVLIEKNSDKTTLTNINIKNIRVLAKTGEGLEELTPLMTNWYSGYDSSGKSFKGVMSVAQKSVVIQHLTRLPFGNKLVRQDQIQFVTQKHSQVIEASSQVIKEGFMRQIARENEMEKDSPSKKSMTEEEELRKLFRKKNGIE